MWLIEIKTSIAKPCTQIHPASSTSIQLHPAQFSFHPAYYNTLNIIRTKILNGQFFQI